MRIRVIPVLDLMGGRVVRGVAGKRSEYRPVVSRLSASAEPVAVARAFRDALGLSELYLADLDAIAGGAPAFSVYEELHALGCRLWVDAGVRQADDAAMLVARGVEKIVAGLETLAGHDALAALTERWDDQVVFSLDLKSGEPLGSRDAWGASEAWPIAQRAVAAGVKHLIVLDLARVGVGAGTGTEDLCRRLAQTYPDVEVVAGGGVRTLDDVSRLGHGGVRAVLVASALHDGAITRGDLETLRDG